MADDVAALLGRLHIERADVFGYSMGGSVALGLAIRRPKVVGRVAINGAHYAPIAEASNRSRSSNSKTCPRISRPRL